MFLHVSSGRGPVECERAVKLFSDAIIKELSALSFAVDISRREKGSACGCYKSVTISLVDVNKLPQDIQGSVLWICKSDYRKGVKRKNWYIQVKLCQDFQAIEHCSENIVITTMRSPGAGGQNVNKVETGVRAVYQQLGISVSATKEPSQSLNKKLALKLVEEKIRDKNQFMHEEYQSDLWSNHNALERGNPVRIYEGKAFKRIK